MEDDIDNWIRGMGEEVLRKIGVKKGKTILDWGCGRGYYIIPAAKIVGKEGKVYALDKNKEALDEVMEKAKSGDLKNIERMETSGELKVALGDESVDIVLLYDVLHFYYFSGVEDRRRLLDEVHRILKPGGLLSVYPKHMEIEQLRAEIERANFHIEREYSQILLVHEEKLQRGRILNFKKMFNTRP